ncbi:ComEA family DNA-binding protein [Paenibacillus oryzisoli]|uniref:ComEA family DNA-binding protein n=1 Tax=Paenibacillus oryzisoli TaxID=1850517 RepID=UPI000AC30907|nr:helix-hairpin-helix domain-containing protein [Paenibacillus oryzisoli]
MDLFGNRVKRIGLILGGVALFVWVVWPFLRGGQPTIRTAFSPMNTQMEELLLQGENEKKAAEGKAVPVGTDKPKVTPKASATAIPKSEVVSTSIGSRSEESNSVGTDAQDTPSPSEPQPILSASPVPSPTPVPTWNESQKGLLDLNTATLEQLDKLPGIGESKARAILEYRMKKGRFKRVEELMDVKGIGEKMFAKIKGQVFVVPR